MESRSGVRMIDFSTIVLFFLLVILAVVFFFSLSVVNPPLFSDDGAQLSPEDKSFGLWEILTGVAFAAIVTAFLIWSKSITINNAYLGTGIGLIGLIVLYYGFSARYSGPKSLIFSGVGALIILSYLSLNFFKFKNRRSIDKNEFDDS
jgi:hypothetical protein